MRLTELMHAAKQDADLWAAADARGRCDLVKRLCLGRYKKHMAAAVAVRILEHQGAGQALTFIDALHAHEDRQSGLPGHFKATPRRQYGDN